MLKLQLVVVALYIITTPTECLVPSGCRISQYQNARYNFHHGRKKVKRRNKVQMSLNTDGYININRRNAISIGLTSITTLSPSISEATTPEIRAAKRPFAYRVDSTIPPTLLPLTASLEQSVLKGLGKGSGTSKAGVVVDRVNLNNIGQKIVFGSIDAVRTIIGVNEEEERKKGDGYASFVAMGVPKRTTDEDILLGKSLLTFMMQGRRSKRAATALGLYFAPLSTQAALRLFNSNGDFRMLKDSLQKAGVSSTTIELYKPIFIFAKSNGMDLLALSPEVEDLIAVRAEGLQTVDSDRRSTYVIDSEGFIQQTADPKFRLYSDRSLLKDFEPINEEDQPGNFFAERILVHETAATALAQYSVNKPDSLVAFFAPMADVRFMGGANGRLPRVCRFLNPTGNKVTEDAITTILLNPTAKETLSLSRYLRLEIGTSPKTLPYQTKVADYFWFSKMPKVNMIPRLMNN